LGSHTENEAAADAPTHGTSEAPAAQPGSAEAESGQSILTTEDDSTATISATTTAANNNAPAASSTLEPANDNPPPSEELPEQ
jgi:hypothetical protein